MAVVRRRLRRRLTREVGCLYDTGMWCVNTRNKLESGLDRMLRSAGNNLAQAVFYKPRCLSLIPRWQCIQSSLFFPMQKRV